MSTIFDLAPLGVGVTIAQVSVVAVLLVVIGLALMRRSDRRLLENLAEPIAVWELAEKTGRPCNLVLDDLRRLELAGRAVRLDERPGFGGAWVASNERGAS